MLYKESLWLKSFEYKMNIKWRRTWNKIKTWKWRNMKKWRRTLSKRWTQNVKHFNKKIKNKTNMKRKKKPKRSLRKDQHTKDRIYLRGKITLKTGSDSYKSGKIS